MNMYVLVNIYRLLKVGIFLNFNIVYAIATVKSLAVSSVAAAAAHNDNDITSPPFHLSVC